MTLSAISGAAAAWQAAGAQKQQHRRPDDSNMLDPAAQALGMSTDDLKVQLSQGKTLADVASAQGVSKDDVVAAIAKDMQAHRPDGAPALDDAKATEMATQIVEGKGPGGHRHGHGAPPPVGATGATSTTSSLQSLADALGVDSQDLWSQLSTGDTSSVASSNAWTADKSQSSGLLVDSYA